MRKGETHTAPISRILASDLAVGSSVFVMENGVATEYLVVNQGKPSGSSLYDDSCDGTWLLRKDIKEKRQWNSSDVNDYENSLIHPWLNGDFFNQFGVIEQSIIKQVKIPYRAGQGQGTTITGGSSGLSTKVFLLSAAELNWSSSISSKIPDDGSCLSYFNGTRETDSKRTAYLNGSETAWWTRSPYLYYYLNTICVLEEGRWFGNNCSGNTGVRPAIILPSNALFSKTTMLLKGVA